VSGGSEARIGCNIAGSYNAASRRTAKAGETLGEELRAPTCTMATRGLSGLTQAWKRKDAKNWRRCALERIISDGTRGFTGPKDQSFRAQGASRRRLVL
jgi:hypothetical protein